MKNTSYILLFWGLCWLGINPAFGQEKGRITRLQNQLDSLSNYVAGLNEQTNIALRDVPVSEYVRAIGVQHKVNIYIDDTPDQNMTSNLSNEPVKSVFLLVCKTFSYDLEITGTIIQFVPYAPPQIEEIPTAPKTIDISYEEGKLSFDLEGDSLLPVLRKISQLTGRKIVTRPGTQGSLTAFLPPTEVDTALEALFIANGYRISPRRKGYYVVQQTQTTLPNDQNNGPAGRTDFTVEAFTDADDDFVSIQAEGADLEALVKSIFEAVGVDYLIYESLRGVVTIDADITKLDDILRYIFQGTEYTYKQDDVLYLVGGKDLEGLRSTQIVKMKYRPTFQAIELIPGVSVSQSAGNAGRNNQFNGGRNNQNQIRNNNNLNNQNFNNNLNGGFNNGFNNSGFGNGSINSGANQIYTDASLPPDIIKASVGEVVIVEYPELNRIILEGPTDQVKRIAYFLEQVDRPVPMVKVEMVVVEVNRERLLSTGVRAGLRQSGDSIPGTKDVLPGVDYNLDGEDINAIIGGIPALSNIGVLKSDFYLQLRAQEINGNIKVRMQPVLSMLNGRSASLVIGQTQYYLLETQTASTGAVNNFQTFTQRFESIEASVSLSLKPYISEDDMVTLEILPDFTTPIGTFSSEVPPTIATRRFDSTIRVKNGETVILGGLTEEEVRDNTRGFPLLSRIPIIRRFAGNVDTGRTNNSLIIYITPNIYYN